MSVVYPQTQNATGHTDYPLNATDCTKSHVPNYMNSYASTTEHQKNATGCQKRTGRKTRNMKAKSNPTGTTKKALGDWGENAVAEYLQERGYIILDKQWRCRYGELDLVAHSPENILCFVEVKLRSSRTYGLPREAVGQRKQKNLRNAAALYFTRCGLDLPCRFDVAEVYANRAHEIIRIDYLKDALYFVP